MMIKEIRQDFQGNFSLGAVVPIDVHKLFEFDTLAPNAIVPAFGLIRWRRVKLKDALVSLLALSCTHDYRF